MGNRRKEIAFWLAHLKANAAGKARLKIRDNVSAFVTSFIKDPPSIRNSYLNFAFLGPAGTGKSQLAKSLGKVIASLGLLSTDNFFSLTAADFNAQYTGQTAVKTQKVLLEGLEGVTFLDEAYALAAGDNKFGKEAIAQIVATLDKTIGQMSMMVAGYEEDMREDFFGVNPGMARRFPYQWVLENYRGDDLMDIFESFFTRNQQKMGDYLTPDAQEYVRKFMEQFYEYFTSQAGDVQQIFSTSQSAFVKGGNNLLDRRDMPEVLAVVIGRMKPTPPG
jgi:hypothetical protein